MLSLEALTAFGALDYNECADQQLDAECESRTLVIGDSVMGWGLER